MVTHEPVKLSDITVTSEMASSPVTSTICLDIDMKKAVENAIPSALLRNSSASRTGHEVSALSVTFKEQYESGQVDLSAWISRVTGLFGDNNASVPIYSSERERFMQDFHQLRVDINLRNTFLKLIESRTVTNKVKIGFYPNLLCEIMACTLNNITQQLKQEADICAQAVLSEKQQNILFYVAVTLQGKSDL